MKLHFKNKLFSDFYKNNRLQQIEKLINWCVVFNPECPEHIYKYLLKAEIKEDDKEDFTSNYLGSRTDNKVILSEVSENDIKYLMKASREYDGTLLFDVFANFMQKHKLF